MKTTLIIIIILLTITGCATTTTYITDRDLYKYDRAGYEAKMNRSSDYYKNIDRNNRRISGEKAAYRARSGDGGTGDLYERSNRCNEITSRHSTIIEFIGFNTVTKYSSTTYTGRLRGAGCTIIHFKNGDTGRYMNTVLHNPHGPALILVDGTQVWWINGRIHRNDGPALISPNGYNEWWINGIKYYTNRPR